MDSHSQPLVFAGAKEQAKMDTNVLQFLPSKSLPSTSPIYTNPSIIKTTQTQIFIPHRKRSLRLNSTNNTSNNNETPQPAPPTITPPDTVEIRFKRGSRKRRQQRDEDIGGAKPVKAQAPDSPKKWEDMSLTEKTLELYMGEKGLLFWLNKFAYASIFIVIGGWILFRFVGPSLNLYQLDTPPLAPSSMFKGS